MDDRVPVESAYRGKRVLLTGLSGFKGTWLALWLERLGAEVLGFALEPTDEMAAGWPGLKENQRLNCVYADVRDLDAVGKTVDAFRPEIVFHLAAQPLVRLSYDEPVETYATNVMGTVHVLEACRRQPAVEACIVVTTDKCYENREWHYGYREHDPVGGHDPYSSSKACAELVTDSYRRAFGPTRPDLKIASARAGNVIGGGDWALDRLVPDIVRAILSDEPVRLRRPDALRPWQHVVEPLMGYLMLGAALLDRRRDADTAWNFGPTDAVPRNVRQIAELAIEHFGRGEIVEDAVMTGPKEARFLKLDSSKAIAELGWLPLLDDATRLAMTIDWYAAWRDDPTSVWDVTLEQIAAVEAVAVASDVVGPRWSSPTPTVAKAA